MDIKHFPFPFEKDHYEYSINLRPLDGPSIDVTDSYNTEIEERRELLSKFHDRCYQAFPHTLEAQWEVVELLATDMARTYPDQFKLAFYGEEMVFLNRLTGEETMMIYGSPKISSWQPLDFIGRHVQEDLIILMQRDGDLFMDAGQLCFPANWSLAFDLGMKYTEFHSPVPIFSESLAPKVRSFLMRMTAGEPWTRLNWTMTVGNRLDTSTETFGEWRPDWKRVTRQNVGDIIHMRVEVQNLYRLPRSNGILFTIHTYLEPLGRLVEVPTYKQRMQRVFAQIPDVIAEYKAIAPYFPMVREYLNGQMSGVDTRGSP